MVLPVDIAQRVMSMYDDDEKQPLHPREDVMNPPEISLLLRPVDKTCFLARTYNRLWREGVLYNGDTVTRTERELDDFSQIGTGAMDEIRGYVSFLDLSLRLPEESLAARLQYLYGDVEQAPISCIRLVAYINPHVVVGLARLNVRLASDLKGLSPERLQEYIEPHLSSSDLVIGLRKYLGFMLR